MLLTPAVPFTSDLHPAILDYITSGSVNTTQTNTQAISLPADIASGDLLLMFVGAFVGSAATVTTPSGWTQLSNFVGPGNVRRALCYYKVASGSEGSSVTLTASRTVTWTAVVYRIGNYQGTPQASSSATGTSTAPNAASLTPSWGTDSALWFAAAYVDNTNFMTGWPSGFPNIVDYGVPTSGWAVLSTVWLNAVASSMDPGAWALSASNTWGAITVAVRGS